MSELPAGVGIERIFVVEGHYASDAAARRPPVRSEHLARVAEGLRAGRVVAAGGLEDLSRSLLLLRAADEAAARAWAQADVYIRSGVWSSVEILPFGLVRIDAEAR